MYYVQFKVCNIFQLVVLLYYLICFRRCKTSEGISSIASLRTSYKLGKGSCPARHKAKIDVKPMLYERYEH